MDARIVLTSAASREEAERLARTLVEERLAACATLIPGAQSIYRWEGKIESSAETLLLLKTEAGRLAEIEARLHALHSYTAPEFLVLRVDAGSRPYASRQFAQHPYSMVSLDDILAEAALTEGAMYFHFASKQALALAIIDDLTEMSRAAVTELVARKMSGLEQ